MNKIEKLHNEINKIEILLLEEVKKLPKWNIKLELWNHNCKSREFQFCASTGDDLLDMWLQDKVICLKCGGYFNVFA